MNIIYNGTPCETSECNKSLKPNATDPDNNNIYYTGDDFDHIAEVLSDTERPSLAGSAWYRAMEAANIAHKLSSARSVRFERDGRERLHCNALECSGRKPPNFGAISRALLKLQF